ncbi:carbohydrate ABC transporter permease [Chloroflexi bacterium TSY]|nr:carbohydrate ABC transporter permease [Chloroflexi bacterium TSY]
METTPQTFQSQSTQQIPWYQRRSVRDGVGNAFTYLLLTSLGVLLMIPFFWMLSSSFKQEFEIFQVPPIWIPSKIQWHNYIDALDRFPFFLGLQNTLIITISVIIGRLLSTSMAAFAFARMRFRLREPLFILVLATRMIPYHITLIPTYVLFQKIGWVDTFLPLIIPNWLGLGAFYIFLLRQFFLSIPREMDDAARIDGCSNLGIYWRIILPLSKPALATVSIFTFLEQWNDFLAPIIYLNSTEKHTLAIAMQFYRTAAANSGFGPTRTWAHLMVVSILVMLPCLILFFFAQRYFIQGVVVSGVKG